MDAEDASYEEIEPDPETGDLIVGTLRPPAWLGRIPALAWLFIGLAAVDGVYRIWRAAPWSLDWVSPTNVAGLVFSIVNGAAVVLLPAAIVLGRSGRGRAGSWLLQGALALAAAELVGLLGQRVLQAVFGPPSLEPGLFGVVDFWVRSMAVEVPALLLQVFGLAKIGLGLRIIAAPTRPFGRILFAVPAAALAVLLLADLMTIQVSQAAPATGPEAILFGYNLLIVVAEAVVLVLWAWIASLAYRQDGRAWRWITIGAVAIALGSVVRAIGWIDAIQRTGTDDAQMILTWFGLAASAVGAVGVVFVVLGFAAGFEPRDVGDGSETAPGEATDVDPVSRPAGA